jgi:hypothetical protein
MLQRLRQDCVFEASLMRCVWSGDVWLGKLCSHEPRFGRISKGGEKVWTSSACQQAHIVESNSMICLFIVSDCGCNYIIHQKGI